MAMERNNSHLNIAAPPPSPIPTGRGSRSAANDTFSEFLQKSVHLPHLELPGSHFHVTTRHPVPEAVDLRSLAARGGDSVDRILRSAREYGAFRISGHGISGDELRSLVEEADWEENFVVSNGNREEIVWGRSQQQCFESARKLSGTDRFRNFSQNMENIASKLEAIAKQVSQIFIENAGKQFTSGKQEKETLLTLYRYNHHNPLMEQNPPLTNEKIGKLCDHVFSLHLPIELCQVRVQSGRFPLSFEAGPDIIVVTVGKQLEEWSLGKFKCVSGEMIFVPDLHGSQTSFSVELKFSSSSIIPRFDKKYKTISVTDQILVPFIVAFLYKIFVYILSET